MSEGFLLSRLLLRFDAPDDTLMTNLSAIAMTPDGSLWLGSDEGTCVERLSPLEPQIYGAHVRIDIGQLIQLPNTDDEEIDIEGLDYSNDYLWLTGSHSAKRKKPKGKGLDKDLQRLAEIKVEKNRFILARIPVVNGELVKSVSPDQDQTQKLSAGCLSLTEDGNILFEALKQDEHLGLFASHPIPSKENGFDIEGLAVINDTVFLGLRGPVLRGWSVVLEIKAQEQEPGVLSLETFDGTGLCYKKHFFNLNGLGIRELCLQGEDLIILAGPTMALEGIMQVFRWKNALGRASHTLNDQNPGELEVVFDLPFCLGHDHAEGLELVPSLGHSEALMVVYDSPNPSRIISPREVFADVFRLP